MLIPSYTVLGRMSLSLSDFDDLLGGNGRNKKPTKLGDSLSDSVDADVDSVEAVREIREDV